MPNSLMESKTKQDWINFVLAVGLLISPWVMRFAGEMTPTRNVWIVGIVLGALTVATISAFAEWEEWISFALGLWLIVSPWLLGFTANVHAMWTHVIMGVLVAAVSAWAIWGHRHIPHAHA